MSLIIISDKFSALLVGLSIYYLKFLSLEFRRGRQPQEDGEEPAELEGSALGDGGHYIYSIACSIEKSSPSPYDNVVLDSGDVAFRDLNDILDQIFERSKY